MRANPFRWLLAAAMFLSASATIAAIPGDEIDFGPAFVDIAGGVFERAAAVAVQPDGKILLAGNVMVGERMQLAFARIFPDGAPDMGFADGGQRRVNFGSSSDASASWIGTLPDGRILIVGSVADTSMQSLSIVVLRLLPDGEFDVTFSIDGRARFGEDIGAFCDFPFGLDGVVSGCGVVLLPDGSVVVAGGALGAASPQGGGVLGAGVLLYKIRPDATPDPGFGTAGRRLYATLPGHPDAPYFGLTSALALRDNGRFLLAAGAATSAQPSIALAQFLPNGAPDTGFGVGGGVLVPAESGDAFLPNSVQLTRDGNIMVGAFALLSGVRAFVAARFLASGVPDASYGSGGVTGVAFDLSGEPESDDAASAMHVDSAGRAYVVGYAEMPDFDGEDNHDVAIARFTPQGLPDASFGPGGKRTYGFDVSAGGGPFTVLRERAYDVAVDALGRMVVVGASDGPADFDRMQVRTIFTHDLFGDTFE